MTKTMQMDFVALMCSHHFSFFPSLREKKLDVDRRSPTPGHETYPDRRTVFQKKGCQLCAFPTTAPDLTTRTDTPKRQARLRGSARMVLEFLGAATILENICRNSKLSRARSSISLWMWHVVLIGCNVEGTIVKVTLRKTPPWLGMRCIRTILCGET